MYNLDINLKIANLILQPDLPGANELTLYYLQMVICILKTGHHYYRQLMGTKWVLNHHMNQYQ